MPSSSRAGRPADGSHRIAAMAAFTVSGENVKLREGEVVLEKKGFWVCNAKFFKLISSNLDS